MSRTTRTPDNEGRGTGRTAQQMKDAPHGALYVWVNSNLRYPLDLARSLGRADLEIVSPDWLVSDKWRGRKFSDVVRDHALLFTPRWYDAYEELMARHAWERAGREGP